MIGAVTLLLTKKILLDKENIIQTFVRIPFSLIFPILFLVRFLHLGQNNIIVSVMIWTCCSTVFFDSYLIADYELKNNYATYITLTGRSYYSFRVLSNCLLLAINAMLYSILIGILILLEVVEVKQLAFSPLLLIAFSVLISVNFINSLQIKFKEKQIFNIFNSFIDILFIVSGIMFPIHFFGQSATFLYLIPTALPFSLLNGETEISWIEPVLFILSISLIVYMTNQNFKAGNG
ncbi:hypothetical protein RsY01_1353 [Lactococcus reticulitermitis]|uniref:Uncharacterized protein n=2 Tax=Pseudolactococcus reticulitermitis TaxID=2025039 RepID=A0A224XDT9_9LACT|nr:hypothetical protein RsY01_1353 [Lactococcus reticulitermitis]